MRITDQELSQDLATTSESLQKPKQTAFDMFISLEHENVADIELELPVRSNKLRDSFANIKSLLERTETNFKT